LKNDIVTGKFYGLIECNIDTPEHLKEKFSKLLPFVMHHKVTADLLDKNCMAPLAPVYMKTAKESVISSYKAENVILISEYAKWLLEFDINFISKITESYQWHSSPYFSNICQNLTHNPDLMVEELAGLRNDFQNQMFGYTTSQQMSGDGSKSGKQKTTKKRVLRARAQVSQKHQNKRAKNR
jgi:hypothetical protein